MQGGKCLRWCDSRAVFAQTNASLFGSIPKYLLVNLFGFIFSKVSESTGTESSSVAPEKARSIPTLQQATVGEKNPINRWAVPIQAESKTPFTSPRHRVMAACLRLDRRAVRDASSKQAGVESRNQGGRTQSTVEMLLISL